LAAEYIRLFEMYDGAADGYGRIADKPACTLLHLGPGYGNGVANLHNARRAHSPIVNVIGDHATYHRTYDAPLTSDIEGTARPFHFRLVWPEIEHDDPKLSNEILEAASATFAQGERKYRSRSPRVFGRQLACRQLPL